MNIRDAKNVSERRKIIERECSVSLSHIGSGSLDEAKAGAHNCENMIGATQVPLGIAGPLSIGKKEYYIPLATTEGALVASVSRGCKAITESGGAVVDSHVIGATRGPVFKVDTLAENKALYEFIMLHFDEMKRISESTSRHLVLKKISSRGVGRYRYIRFVYETGDAMGLNMVTIATEKVVRFIEEKTGTRCLSLAGNFDVDKKPSWQNFLNNRGTKAWAEVELSRRVLSDVLKTDAQRMYDVWLSKCMIGSAMSGSMGFNAQYANVLAAFFIATGQDPAHVSECSVGITTTEITNENGLYVSVYLPDLMVGTVGGGTGLATQREALSILGVKNSRELAEVTVAAVMAGEISLLASLAEGSLAKAHQRLARGQKI